MKSETYQKEGWFILEVDNSVFGKEAENIEYFDNDENLIFNHKNKEESENNIDNSAKDLTDFFELVSKDVPDLSEEEINKGIEKILEKAYPEEARVEPIKTVKKRKVSLKVLFLAAVLSIIVAVCCIGVVGSSHDLKIENGLATFAKDTLQIVFFGESKDKYITVDALLTDLESHGYEDILFPQEFVTKSDEYKVSVPKYCNDSLGEQVSFEFFSNELVFNTYILKGYSNTEENLYVNIKNAKSIHLNDVIVYLYNTKEKSYIEYFYEEYHLYVTTDYIPYSDLINFIKT